MSGTDVFLRCVSNRAADLSDHQLPRGALRSSTWPITAGGTYLALGMILWENVLSVLVPDDYGGPCYAPAGLFDVGTWQVPAGWAFGLFPGLRVSGTDLWSDPYQAAWGYHEFVHDPSHGIGLSERRPDDLAVFDARVRAAQAKRR